MSNFKAIGAKYSEVMTKECFWVNQRAKANWLTRGEVDLQFLYNSIKEMRSSNLIRGIHVDNNFITDPNLISSFFCDYYFRLFNTSQASIDNNNLLDHANILSSDQALEIGESFSEK